MDSYRTSSPVERDASVDRLRSLTSTALVAGAAAVVTFGVAAAISNPGRQASTATNGSTSVQGGNSSTTGSSGSSNGSDSVQGGSTSDQSGLGSGSGSTSQPNGFFQAPAQQPQTFFGGGQSTTGGS